MNSKFLKLRDPEHRFPVPGSPGLLFPKDGMLVDADEAIWASLLADGSLEIADPPIEPASSATPAWESASDQTATDTNGETS